MKQIITIRVAKALSPNRWIVEYLIESEDNDVWIESTPLKYFWRKNAALKYARDLTFEVRNTACPKKKSTSK